MTWTEDLRQYVLDNRFNPSGLPSNTTDYIITGKIDPFGTVGDKTVTIGYLGEILWGSYIGDKVTGLEYIAESSDLGCISGWRLICRNPLYYGAIGSDAIDISYSDVESDVYGATGVHAFAFGEYTISSGIASTAGGHYTIAKNNYSTSLGKYNVGTDNDTIFEVGIGTSDVARVNALEIFTDGSINAPDLTIAEIDSRGIKALITKEYLDSVNDYITGVNADNISNVIFSMNVGDDIITSFDHVHINYALIGWVEDNYASINHHITHEIGGNDEIDIDAGGFV